MPFPLTSASSLSPLWTSPLTATNLHPPPQSNVLSILLSSTHHRCTCSLSPPFQYKPLKAESFLYCVPRSWHMIGSWNYVLDEWISHFMELCEKGPAVQLERDNKLRVRQTVFESIPSRGYLLPLKAPPTARPQWELSRMVQCVWDRMWIKNPLRSRCFLPRSWFWYRVQIVTTCACTRSAATPATSTMVRSGCEGLCLGCHLGRPWKSWGQERGQPCPHAKPSYAELESSSVSHSSYQQEQAGPLYLLLPTQKCLEVEEQYWWPSYPSRSCLGRSNSHFLDGGDFWMLQQPNR